MVKNSEESQEVQKETQDAGANVRTVLLRIGEKVMVKDSDVTAMLRGSRWKKLARKFKESSI